MKKQKQSRSLHYQFNNLEEQHKIKTNITIPKFHYSSISSAAESKKLDNPPLLLQNTEGIPFPWTQVGA